MFFQDQSTTNSVAGVAGVAAGVIYALAPAFAAGFGIQRAIEIFDSWISLEKRIGPESKAAVLNLISLLLALFLAVHLDIRVLHTLGQSFLGEPLSTFIDYIVSGLIISAGTEGFNSIIKFLLYAKETKKAEAVTEKETAITATGMRRMSFVSEVNATIGSPDFQPTGDPDVDLSGVLHDMIKDRWPSKFMETDWEERTFDEFTEDDSIPKILVGQATRIVATGYGKLITAKSIANLQTQVKLATAPEDILPEMLTVLLLAKP